jgi:AcrR family transcriptional regulator
VTSATRRGRRPGGDSARGAVLDAARNLFSQQGFDRTTIRAIAAQAQVDPALVHHFYGTKEQLFRATLEFPLDPERIVAGLDAHPGDEGRALVAGVLRAWSAPVVREQLTALLRSALTQDHARDVLRELLTEQLVGRVARTLSVEDAELRASLVATQMAGLALGRLVMELGPLTAATDEQLVEAIGPTVQRYLTGSIGPKPPSRTAAPNGATATSARRGSPPRRRA